MIKIKIKEYLDKIDKTPYWLAKESRISPNAILKLVNGETTSISFDSLDKICEVLNCDLSQIIERVPN